MSKKTRLGVREKIRFGVLDLCLLNTFTTTLAGAALVPGVFKHLTLRVLVLISFLVGT